MNGVVFMDQKGSGLIPTPDPAQGMERIPTPSSCLVYLAFGHTKSCPFFLLYAPEDRNEGREAKPDKGIVFVSSKGWRKGDSCRDIAVVFLTESSKQPPACWNLVFL